MVREKYLTDMLKYLTDIFNKYDVYTLNTESNKQQESKFMILQKSLNIDLVFDDSKNYRILIVFKKSSCFIDILLNTYR